MKELQNLRTEIDALDEKIVELFKKRFAVVEKVKIFKDSHAKNATDFQLHIKPDREFEVVSNVLKLSGDLQNSAKFLFNTWRGVIASANFLEQDLRLISTCDVSKSSIFQYYLMQKDVEMAEIHDAFAKLSQDECHILAFHQTNCEAFEVLKKLDSIRVFAQSADGTFLCGKIVAPKFTQPAMVLTQMPTEIVINQKAGVFASPNCEKYSEKHTLGAFYPYFS